MKNRFDHTEDETLQEAVLPVSPVCEGGWDAPDGEEDFPDAPEKRCYTVEDLQNILMCGKKAVYELLKRNEFRYFRLGRGGYRISRKSFDEWLDNLASADAGTCGAF